LEGGGIFTPPPQVTPVFIGYVKIECSELWVTNRKEWGNNLPSMSPVL
jgi:hypothetical protein